MMASVEYILIVVVVILLSMTTHEAMHAFVGYWLGDETAKLQGRLTLNPLKHIDPFLTILLPIMLAITGGPIFGGAKPVPFNFNNVRWGEWGVALIALAGPLTNLMIAFVAFGIWVLAGTPVHGIVGQIFAVSVSVNLGFFVFNMIPIPPLDGSRVIYALAPDFIRNIMAGIERFGIMVIFGMLLVAGSTFTLFISNVIQFIVYIFERVFGL